GSLQGMPPAGFQGSLVLQLVITDQYGEHVVHFVQLHFGDPPAQPDKGTPQKPTAREMPAKPGLNAQFSRHASSAPISEQAARALRLMHTRESDRVSPL